MQLTPEQQVEFLKTVSRSSVIERIRSGLMQVAGRDVDTAAKRLLTVFKDSMLSGVLSSNLEKTEYEVVDGKAMATLVAKAKLLTPPDYVVRKELLLYNVPLPLANKVIFYMDFLNFKHHIAALILCIFLVEVFKQ